MTYLPHRKLKEERGKEESGGGVEERMDQMGIRVPVEQEGMKDDGKV